MTDLNLKEQYQNEQDAIHCSSELSDAILHSCEQPADTKSISKSWSLIKKIEVVAASFLMVAVLAGVAGAVTGKLTFFSKESKMDYFFSEETNLDDVEPVGTKTFRFGEHFLTIQYLLGNTENGYYYAEYLITDKDGNLCAASSNYSFRDESNENEWITVHDFTHRITAGEDSCLIKIVPENNLAVSGIVASEPWDSEKQSTSSLIVRYSSRTLTHPSEIIAKEDDPGLYFIDESSNTKTKIDCLYKETILASVSAEQMSFSVGQTNVWGEWNDQANINELTVILPDGKEMPIVKNGEPIRYSHHWTGTSTGADSDGNHSVLTPFNTILSPDSKVQIRVNGEIQ